VKDMFVLLGLSFVPVTGLLLVFWRSAVTRAERAEAIIDDLAVSRSTSRTDDVEQLARRMAGMSDEIQRLADSQRYLVHMMSERRETPVQLPPRVVTPH
jgi:hypothetical protein